MADINTHSLAVLGLGNWGTALANHLSHMGHDVLAWCKEPEIVESINNNHRNALFLSDVALHPSLRASNKIEQVLNRSIVVLVLPSHVLSKVTPLLKLNPGTLLVSAVKGIDAESLLTPLQFLKRELGDKIKLAALSGPSFARDVVQGKPCSVVSASEDLQVSIEVAKIFTSNRMRVYSSNDPIGVEIGSVVKNVIALAAGACDGLELGDSARASLITRGLAEMTRLAQAMGAEAKTLSGLSGLGDLVVTCTSTKSRNHTVGFRIAKGEDLRGVIQTLGSVAEGVNSTPLVMKLAEKYKVEMPIVEVVSRVLSGASTPAEMLESLMSRPIRGE